MKAIIPIAGVGTRMRPHTLNHAKVLLPVAGKPMISYIVDALIENEINNVVFIIGYLGEQVKDYIETTYPSLKTDFIEQKEMLGLGHAVYMAEPFVKDEEILIILGDTLFDVNFSDMISTPHSNLGVKTVDDPSRFGVAVVNDRFIQKLVEKPKTPVSNLALVGLYYVKNGDFLMTCIKEIMKKKVRTSGEYQLTDALQLMIEKGEKFTPFQVENWYDCGKKETVLETNRIILQNHRDNSADFMALKTVRVINPVYIGTNVKLKNCIIGPNVSIGDDSEIEGSVIKNSIIGNETVIKNCCFDDSIIGNFAVVSRLAEKVNLSDYSIVE